MLRSYGGSGTKDRPIDRDAIDGRLSEKSLVSFDRRDVFVSQRQNEAFVDRQFANDERGPGLDDPAQNRIARQAELWIALNQIDTELRVNTHARAGGEF